MGGRVLRTAALVAMALVAASCQATAAVDLQIQPNGQGTLSVVVTADLKLEGESLRITATDVASLDQAAEKAGGGMRVWLQETAAVPHIQNLLTREGQGRGRVILIPRLEEGTQDVEITLPGNYNVTPRLAQALKVLPGVERVEDM